MESEKAALVGGNHKRIAATRERNWKGRDDALERRYAKHLLSKLRQVEVTIDGSYLIGVEILWGI